MNSKKKKKTVKFRILKVGSVLADKNGIIKLPITKVRLIDGRLAVVVKVYDLQAVYLLSSDFKTCKWLGYIGARNPIKNSQTPEKEAIIEFFLFNKTNPCRSK